MTRPLDASSAEGLVGREAELAVAALAVRELDEGQASVLAIEGEAGIGKTRLVQSIVGDAHARGLAVFRGPGPSLRAHPAVRRGRRGARSAPAVGGPAPGCDRRAADRPGRRGAGTARRHVQYRAVEEIVDLVETSCAERPVLLVAEDIHWADSASLLAILSLVRQLPLAALLVVVTARPWPRPAEVVRLLDDLEAAGARTLRLEPLTPDDVAVLARAHARGVPRPLPDRHAGQGGREPAVGRGHAALAGRRRDAAPRRGRRRADDLRAARVAERPRDPPPAAPADSDAGAAAGHGGAGRRRVASRCRRRRRAGRRPRSSASSATRSTLSCSTRPTTGSCSGTSSCTTRSTSTCRRRPAACCTGRPRWR